jgi:hypothetical protein
VFIRVFWKKENTAGTEKALIFTDNVPKKTGELHHTALRFCEYSMAKKIFAIFLCPAIPAAKRLDNSFQEYYI